MIEEIDGEESEEEDEDKKDVFPFHFLPRRQRVYPFERTRRMGVSARMMTLWAVLPSTHRVIPDRP